MAEISGDRLDAILAAIARQTPVKTIAKQIGVAKSTVYTIAKRHGLRVAGVSPDRQRDPTPEEIEARCREIQFIGFVDGLGRHKPPWTDDWRNGHWIGPARSKALSERLQEAFA